MIRPRSEPEGAREHSAAQGFSRREGSCSLDISEALDVGSRGGSSAQRVMETSPRVYQLNQRLGSGMYVVPEGQHDRSLARSAWDCATPKEPSRRVRYDSRRCGGSAAPDHTVPYGTVLSKDAFPGTSCQATIMLSLRDKRATFLAQNLARNRLLMRQGEEAT